jgi:hypothetical protein
MRRAAKDIETLANSLPVREPPKRERLQIRIVPRHDGDLIMTDVEEPEEPSAWWTRTKRSYGDRD